jgi:hypothetical protein
MYKSLEKSRWGRGPHCPPLASATVRQGLPPLESPGYRRRGFICGSSFLDHASLVPSYPVFPSPRQPLHRRRGCSSRCREDSALVHFGALLLAVEFRLGPV